MNKERFDPKTKFQPIIDQLIEEGRMPSLEEYLKAVAEVREKYQRELKELRRKDKTTEID